jgi:hypothetical protein
VQQEPQNPGTERMPEPTAALEPPPAPGPGMAPPAIEPVVAQQPPSAPRGRGGRLVNVALAGALVLAIAGVAFAAGRFTAPAAVTAGNFPGRGGQGFTGNGGKGGAQNGQAGGIFGGGPTIEGTVESVTDSTLTIKTASGQTIQVALDGTTYHAQTDASASDVTAGGKVLVRLDLRGANGTGNVTSPSASDVTVVP